MIMNAKQRKQLAVRARTSIRENFGIPPVAGWLLVCAAIAVKWPHQFLSAWTVVEAIASERVDIEAVGFEPNLMQTMERWGNADFRVSLQAV